MKYSNLYTTYSTCYLAIQVQRVFAPVYERRISNEKVDGVRLLGVRTGMSGKESRCYCHQYKYKSNMKHLFLIKPRMSNNLAHFNPILQPILQHLLKQISQLLNLIIVQPCSTFRHRAIDYP